TRSIGWPPENRVAAGVTTETTRVGPGAMASALGLVALAARLGGKWRLPGRRGEFGDFGGREIRRVRLEQAARLESGGDRVRDQPAIADVVRDHRLGEGDVFHAASSLVIGVRISSTAPRKVKLPTWPRTTSGRMK